MPDPADQTATPGFAFLLCSERSGSNLITSLMNGHPAISGPPPSHLFRLFGLNADRYWPTTDNATFEALLVDFVDAHAAMLGEWRTSVDVDALRACDPSRGVAGPLEVAYAREAAADSATWSFVKENNTHRIVPFLLANWPTARFVHQVRDPRDVAASYLRTDSIPGGVEEAVSRWLDDQRATLAVFGQIRSTGRAVRIRYEDLVSDPHGITEVLCHALDLEHDPSMLAFHTDPRTQRNADRIDAWANLGRPVMPDNVGKYVDTLSDADLRYVELATAELMTVFGYVPVTDVDGLDEQETQDRLADLVGQLTPPPPLRITTEDERATRQRRQAIIDRVVGREARP